jgi:hypothetical protein
VSISAETKSASLPDGGAITTTIVTMAQTRRTASTTPVKKISLSVEVVTAYHKSWSAMETKIAKTCPMRPIVRHVSRTAASVRSRYSSAIIRFVSDLTFSATVTMTVAMEPTNWNRCVRTSSVI